jgi:hypothetical protein
VCEDAGSHLSNHHRIPMAFRTRGHRSLTTYELRVFAVVFQSPHHFLKLGDGVIACKPCITIHPIHLSHPMQLGMCRSPLPPDPLLFQERDQKMSLSSATNIICKCSTARHAPKTFEKSIPSHEGAIVAHLKRIKVIYTVNEARKLACPRLLPLQR